jgi:hypothetical protein
MVLSELTYEQVVKYKLVDSNLMMYMDDDGNYYIVVEIGAQAIRTVFSVDETAVEQYQSGMRSCSDLVFKAKYGSWPFTKEENEKYYQEHGIHEKLAEIKQRQIDERQAKEIQNKKS